MILKRYILIFTLALMSCAGTNYIHLIGEEGSVDIENMSEQPAEIEFEESNLSEITQMSRKLGEDQIN